MRARDLGSSSLGVRFLPPTQVLEQLVGDASLEKFRKEYEKLHEHLKKVRGARVRQAGCTVVTQLLCAAHRAMTTNGVW